MKTVAMIPANELINTLTAHGMLASTISKSLVKRFKMRPAGVVSKKDIGARRMLMKRLLYRVHEALTEATALVKYTPTTPTTEEREINFYKQVG